LSPQRIPKRVRQQRYEGAVGGPLFFCQILRKCLWYCGLKRSHLILLSGGIGVAVLVALVMRSAVPKAVKSEDSTVLLSGDRRGFGRSGRSEEFDWRSQLWDGEVKRKAGAAEIQAFLEKENFSKDALVGVALLTREDEYLREVVAQYPDDPLVQLLVTGNDVFPEETSEWIARFKALQPDNVVASVLVAGNHLSQRSASRTAMNRVIGLGSEGVFLEMLKPDDVLPDFSDTPAQMLEEIRAERTEIRDALQVSARISEFSDEQFRNYLEQYRTVGEMNALKWAKEQFDVAE
jgi:hypothetical protein